MKFLLLFSEKGAPPVQPGKKAKPKIGPGAKEKENAKPASDRPVKQPEIASKKDVADKTPSKVSMKRARGKDAEDDVAAKRPRNAKESRTKKTTDKTPKTKSSKTAGSGSDEENTKATKTVRSKGELKKIDDKPTKVAPKPSKNRPIGSSIKQKKQAETSGKAKTKSKEIVMDDSSTSNDEPKKKTQAPAKVAKVENNLPQKENPTGPDSHESSKLHTNATVETIENVSQPIDNIERRLSQISGVDEAAKETTPPTNADTDLVGNQPRDIEAPANQELKDHDENASITTGDRDVVDNQSIVSKQSELERRSRISDASGLSKKSSKSKTKRVVADDVIRIKRKPGPASNAKDKIKKFRKKFLRRFGIKTINNKSIRRIQSKLCERYFFNVTVNLTRLDFSHVQPMESDEDDKIDINAMVSRVIILLTNWP